MNQRNDRRGSAPPRASGPTSGGTKPWNVSYCRNYTDRDNKEQTQFLLCGVAFPMKNREGFSIELFFDLRKEDRLVIMPREERGESER